MSLILSFEFVLGGGIHFVKMLATPWM